MCEIPLARPSVKKESFHLEAIKNIEFYNDESD